MNLRALGFKTVVFFTRIFIVAIFVLSLLLGYFIFFPKPNKVYVSLANAKVSNRSLYVRKRPGSNITFITDWVKDVIMHVYNIDMTSKGDNLDAIKSKFINFNEFKNNFLSQNFYKDVVKKKLVLHAIISGAFVSNIDNFVFIQPDVWSITVPVLLHIAGVETTGKGNFRYVTVRVKKVPTRLAPLSGLGVVSVTDAETN